jgi:ATP-dependent DNA ligase
VTLPFHPPVPVAQASPITELPAEFDGAVEPKLDGWRILIDTERGQLFGRSGSNLTERFSDIAEAARLLEPAIIDGELLAVNELGEIEFGKLQRRSPLGPRSRDDFSVTVAAFDALARGAEDLRPLPQTARRQHLLGLLEASSPLIRPVPTTGDPSAALAWLSTPGVEGAVLKPDAAYRPGRASGGWLKWRRTHTVDLIVTGVTATAPAHQALVLSLPDHTGRLRAVAVTLPIGTKLRSEVAPLLHPVGDVQELPGIVAGLPGSPPVRYVPVLPEVVVEVEADQKAPTEWGRFRHNPRLVRVRTDLTPDQVAAATS